MNEVFATSLKNAICWTILAILVLLFDKYAPNIGLIHYTGTIGFWQGVLGITFVINAVWDWIMVTRWWIEK